MPATFAQLELVFSNFITVAIALGGIAALVMLVFGGFQFLTAGGDKESTQRAQKIITYAVAGLVLIIVSWIIIALLSNFLGLDLGHFTLCLPGYSFNSATGGCQ